MGASPPTPTPQPSAGAAWREALPRGHLLGSLSGSEPWGLQSLGRPGELRGHCATPGKAGRMRGPGSGDGGSARGRRTSSSTAMPSPWPESPGDGVRRAGRGDSGVQGWEAGEGTWAVESETRPCSGPGARRKLLSPGAPLGGSEPPVLGAQSRDPLARWGCSASKVWRAPGSAPDPCSARSCPV